MKNNFKRRVENAAASHAKSWTVDLDASKSGKASEKLVRKCNGGCLLARSNEKLHLVPFVSVNFSTERERLALVDGTRVDRGKGFFPGRQRSASTHGAWHRSRLPRPRDPLWKIKRSLPAPACFLSRIAQERKHGRIEQLAFDLDSPIV